MSHAKGWRPQKPDHRDRPYTPTATPVPATVDLRASGFMPDVYDQGMLGSCVPNSNASMVEFVLRKLGLPDFMPSRLFIYALGRQIEGTALTDDSGMEVRDALKVIATYGVCPEAIYPYSDQNPGPFNNQPTPSQLAEAARTRAISYYAIDPHAPNMPLRSCLAEGFPFTFGFSVPALLESQQMADGSQPFLPLPNSTDNQLLNEGHGVKAVGYDWTRRRFPAPAFLIKNSWGAGWGEGGYFWMDYRYFDRLATDVWTIRTET